MSNKQIKRILQRLHDGTHAATTSEELLGAMAKAKAFGKPLVYNFSQHILLNSCLLILSLVLVFWPEFGTNGSLRRFLQENSWLFFAGLISAAISVGVFVYLYKQKSAVSALANIIYQKDAFLDNSLRYKAPFNSEEMRIRFREFDRGNHSREFKEVISGEFEGDEHTFSYDYYRFHYVDKRVVVETSTDSKGRVTTRTRTVYDRYDRFGLIIPFEFVQSLQIFSFALSRSYDSKFTTGSIAFDKKFKVRAVDEFTAAKFLKPAVVVAIQDVSEFLRKMNIEIDASGKMCVSFANSEMVLGNQRYDLSNPEDFYIELAGQTKLRLLERALRFVHQMMKHSDSNF